MKKTMFITAIVILSLTILSFLFYRIYMASPIDSGIEAFSDVMTDFFIVLALLGSIVLCIFSIINYFIKPKNDILHDKQG